MATFLALLALSAAAALWIMPDALDALALRLRARAHQIRAGRAAREAFMREHSPEVEQ